MLLCLGACAKDAGSGVRADAPPRVGNFRRPPGMPIGTGASGAELPARTGDALPLDALAPSPAELANNTDLTIPKYEAASRAPAARVPCAGCVELNVDVSDINQRDEFALDVGGTPITRVVWTVLVTFNSDQLAVQPFVDGKRGKYTQLHVNAFPLATPVEVEQEYKGKAKTLGLVVGSSGAWTGNQTMSVFVDSVRIEGPRGTDEALGKSFAGSDEGFSPRTHEHNPKVVFHPAK